MKTKRRKNAKTKKAVTAEAKLQQIRTIFKDIGKPHELTPEQTANLERERLECAMEEIEEAIDSLSQCRDTAHALETNHDSVTYLTPEVVGKYLRLAIIEAGRTLETELYRLGLLRARKSGSLDLPHFLDKYPKQPLIPFSNLPAAKQMETGVSISKTKESA